ncbi:unnamed protein product, partial [marine sediment metagenome]
HGDIESTYELAVCKDKDLVAKLFAWWASDFDPTTVQDAIDAAEAIVAG